MQDLNDLYYFSAVVDHGGFAAAERALGIPKSRLSRRISQLETELGVRLLQRSTRRFARSEENTSELQSLMRISYAVFCLTQTTITLNPIHLHNQSCNHITLY